MGRTCGTYGRQDRCIQDFGGRPEGGLGVDGRMILKWFFKKWVGRRGLDYSGSGETQLAGACERGEEPSVSMKCGEFLDSMKNCKLRRKDCAAWS